MYFIKKSHDLLYSISISKILLFINLQFYNYLIVMHIGSGIYFGDRDVYCFLLVVNLQKDIVTFTMKRTHNNKNPSLVLML